VAAAAALGAGWTLSAPDVPGSTAWTVAVVGTAAWVVREPTWYFEAPVTTYGWVPAVAAAASAGSELPSASQGAPVTVQGAGMR